MSRRRQIYEGKAKILYEGPEAGTHVQYFKDDATAFNAEKKGTIEGKGVLNNRIPSILHAARQYRHSDPLHPPPEHARAADPRGRDHPARGDRAQRRGRFALQAAGDRGRRRPAPHDHRILLQGRRAGRSAGRAKNYITALGWAGPQEMDDIVGPDASGSTISCPGFLPASASSWSISSSNSAAIGTNEFERRRSCRRRDQPGQLPAVGLR